MSQLEFESSVDADCPFCGVGITVKTGVDNLIERLRYARCPQCNRLLNFQMVNGKPVAKGIYVVKEDGELE